MSNFCFLILHYKTPRSTESCIDSILRLKHGFNDRISIVVVDNGSNDGSGEYIQTKYCSDKRIKVLNSNKNLGFANGNNFGFRYIRNNMPFDFLIVLNNDIIVCQQDTLKKISKLHNLTDFNVLGPDIYNPYTFQHESPCGHGYFQSKDIDNLIGDCSSKLSALKSPSIIDKFGYFFRDLSISKRIIAMKHRFFHDSNFRRWNTEQVGVVLHGSFLVFDKDYCSLTDWIFHPSTFMYFEENFLQYTAMLNKKRIVYSPAISVNHAHGKATSSDYKSWREKQIFFYTNMLASLEAYNKYIKKYPLAN